MMTKCRQCNYPLAGGECDNGCLQAGDLPRNTQGLDSLAAEIRETDDDNTSTDMILENLRFAAVLSDANNKPGIAILLGQAHAEITRLREQQAQTKEQLNKERGLVST